MGAVPIAVSQPVLVDYWSRSAVRHVVVVLGAALLTAASAQMFVPLPFSPVPISGQTFAVLLTAAALGPARGVAAQGLYVALGAIGLPFYAQGAGGVQVVLGATGGYLLGFIAAAAVVGWCARQGFDRSVRGTALSFIAGSLVIYAVGVPWLAAVTGLSLGSAIGAGLLPFLVGDALKGLLAACVLPAAWRLVNR